MEESIKDDLLQSYHMSSSRGLKQSAKWAAEMLYSMEVDEDGSDKSCDMTDSDRPASRADTVTPVNVMNTSFGTQMNGGMDNDPKLMMAKCCYDLGEYERAAYFTKSCSSSHATFLHFYSRYLSSEKRKLDTMAETSCINSDASVKVFSEMRNELQHIYHEDALKCDSFLLYIYGIVLLKLELTSEAIEILVKSIKLEPLNWASWQQLSQIIDDKSQLDKLELPSHWFKKFFLGAVFLELQLNDEALALYMSLKEQFKSCNYILSQIAVAKHNLRDVEGAIELFKVIRETDPCRLNAMDIYSNLLYVKDMRTELSSLAHDANLIDPFRVETCCCIANFYSLRAQHAKAVVYFSRALQLNPRHLSAWTLMGHEYMEMKNTGAAIQAYRSAIKCNKRDYRAWYGLGQTYEILKMPAYSLYYYSVAHCLRPNDPRMMIATGETLEKLERNNDAVKCYWKAGAIALFKLASLYERLHEHDKAAAAFSDYIRATIGESGESTPPSGTYSNDVTHAFMFLARYHMTRNEYKLAQNIAQKCVQYTESRDEAKSLLKEIQKKMTTS